MHQIHGNSFITLTYNNDHLPQNLSLDKTHFQDFIRSLRKRTHKERTFHINLMGIKYPLTHKLRYFMCGEYGEATEKNNHIARPHFHAILFGFGFLSDRYPWRKTKTGHTIYRSPLLEKTWTYGTSEIGLVTYQSAAYVARYTLKKQTGKKDSKQLVEHYENINPETGEITNRVREYTAMSLKPGIGATWFEKYKSDVFPEDNVINPKGHKQAAPGYYRELLRRDDPIQAAKLQQKRLEKAKDNPDNTPKRLKTRENVQNQKLKRLPRESI